MYRDVLGVTTQLVQTPITQCHAQVTGDCRLLEPRRLYVGLRAGSELGAATATLATIGGVITVGVLLVALLFGGPYAN